MLILKMLSFKERNNTDCANDAGELKAEASNLSMRLLSGSLYFQLRIRMM